MDSNVFVLNGTGGVRVLGVEMRFLYSILPQEIIQNQYRNQNSLLNKAGALRKRGWGQYFPSVLVLSAEIDVRQPIGWHDIGTRLSQRC